MAKLPLFFDVEVEWKEKRRGELRAGAFPSVAVTAPPEFQGEAGVWTPEHLFVASVNACFMTTLLAVAKDSGLAIVTFRSKAQGRLDKGDGASYQIIEIILKPELVIRDARDLQRATRIIQKAEKICPVASSIKSLVKVDPEIYHKQLPTQPCPPVCGPIQGGEGE